MSEALTREQLEWIEDDLRDPMDWAAKSHRLFLKLVEEYKTQRQEIERLTAANTRFGQRVIETEQRVAELEQAVRLHLAVAPDDPVLLTPVEQQVVAMRQERDEALSLRDFAKEDRDLYYQRWEAVSKERDEVRRQWHIEQFCNTNGQRQLDDLKATLARVEGERDAANARADKEFHNVESWHAKWTEQQTAIAQAEQREARLRAALDNLVGRCGLIDNPTAQSAIDWNDAIEQAQQALSQLSTDLTDQSEAVHKKEPSGSPD